MQKLKAYYTRRLGISLIALLCFITASAQNGSFGVKFGLNTSNFAGEVLVSESDDDTYRWTDRNNFGILVTYSKFDNLALTAEFNYVNKGSMFQSISQRNVLERNIRLSYLEVPIMAKKFFLTGEKVKPNVFTGPSFNFLFVALEDINEKSLAGLEIRNIDSYDVSNLYNPVELSWVIGFGVHYPITKAYWANLDFRFNGGITDITDNDNDAIGAEKVWTRQNTFTVNLAITIPY